MGESDLKAAEAILSAIEGQKEKLRQLDKAVTDSEGLLERCKAFISPKNKQAQMLAKVQEDDVKRKKYQRDEEMNANEGRIKEFNSRISSLKSQHGSGPLASRISALEKRWELLQQSLPRGSGSTSSGPPPPASLGHFGGSMPQARPQPSYSTATIHLGRGAARTSVTTTNLPRQAREEPTSIISPRNKTDPLSPRSGNPLSPRSQQPPAKPEPKPEPKVEAKPEPKVEPKPEPAKPALKVEVKTETKVESKPARKLEPVHKPEPARNEEVAFVVKTETKVPEPAHEEEIAFVVKDAKTTGDTPAHKPEPTPEPKKPAPTNSTATPKLSLPSTSNTPAAKPSPKTAASPAASPHKPTPSELSVAPTASTPKMGALLAKFGGASNANLNKPAPAAGEPEKARPVVARGQTSAAIVRPGYKPPASSAHANKPAAKPAAAAAAHKPADKPVDKPAEPKAASLKVEEPNHAAAPSSPRRELPPTPTPTPPSPSPEELPPLPPTSAGEVPPLPPPDVVHEEVTLSFQ